MKASTRSRFRLRTGSLAGALTALSLSLGTAPALAGDIRALVLDDHGTPLADAVVIASPVGRAPTPSPTADASVTQDQRNKEFVPHVLAITVGTPVHFPNHDNIRHHVYSFSPAKPFELPLYSGTPAAPVLFDKPGVVILGCNIHDWMVGYIYVSESPYFAKTKTDGTATLGNLPAGEYAVRIWHPQLAADERSTAVTLAVPASGAVATTGRITLKSGFRIRRAPVPGRSGY
jgi:plastocyanin